MFLDGRVGGVKVRYSHLAHAYTSYGWFCSLKETGTITVAFLVYLLLAGSQDRCTKDYEDKNVELCIV